MTSLNLGWLFVDALDFSGRWHLLLIFPLCLAIAVVYKTLRLKDLKDLGRAVLPLWVTMVAGMYAIGVLLYALYHWTA